MWLLIQECYLTTSSRVSELLLLSADRQLCHLHASHSENMLHVDEIMMMFGLHLTKCRFQSASYTEQQSASRHVAPLGHIIPIQPVLLLLINI